MKTAVVLTGTVIPDTVNTKVNEPEQRASDYAKAIRFYLDQTLYPIYFIENSDHRIEEDPNFIPLLGEDRLHIYRDRKTGRPERGKGYEEFRMLDGMVETLQKEGYQRMIKVTGRYILRNVKELIPARTDRAYFDIHPRIKSGIAITSFFVCPPSYYLRHLKGAYAEVDEAAWVSIEKVVFKRFQELEEGAPRLLPREPVFEGRSGSSGNPIGRNSYRLQLRNAYRWLLRAGNWNSISREL